MSLKKAGFAERLQRARDMFSILKGFEGYNPPRTEESLEGFQAFIETLVMANKTVTDRNGGKRFKVSDRRDIYFDSVDSVMKMFTNIMLYIKSKYGQKSTEYAILKTIMNKMKTTKIVKSVNAESAGDQNNRKHYNRSDRSFGSLTQYFQDFITTVLKFEGYNPDVEEYRPAGLQELLVKINKLNDEVATHKSELKTVQDERIVLFNELRDRSNRIKFYVKFKYGSDSTEYNQIRSFRF